MPSKDKAGREYPLTVAAPLALERVLAGHPEVTPIVLEPYWQLALEALAAFGSEPMDPDGSTLARITEGPFDSAAAALDLYKQWTDETTFADLCALLDRPPEWLASAAQTVFDLATAKATAQRAEPIRVPLGQAGGSALCFWIDVLRRGSRGRMQLPSYFWSHDGNAGDAVLCAGPPGESVLAMLWGRWAPGEAGLDLVQHQPLPATTSLAADYGSVSSFLQHVESSSARRQVYPSPGPR
jgi:hypothetical protein